MNRETKLLKIGGVEFSIKTYATAREANEIQKSLFNGAKVEMVGETPKISDFNPTIQLEVEKEMINQLVISVNGNSENVLDKCLDLNNEVYRELVSQLDSMVAKKKS